MSLVRLYVVDNTVLSNFARIEQVNWLRIALDSRSVTTVTVYQELKLGESLGIVPVCNWDWLPVVELTADEHELRTRLRANIDAGEAECLAVAIFRSGTLMTDDRGARIKANHYGVPITGTLGALKILVDDGNMTVERADEYLREMIAQGFHSPVKSLSELHLRS